MYLRPVRGQEATPALQEFVFATRDLSARAALLLFRVLCCNFGGRGDGQRARALAGGTVIHHSGVCG